MEHIRNGVFPLGRTGRRRSRGAPLQRGIDVETSMRRGGHDWMLLMPVDVRRKKIGVGGGAQL